MRAEKRYAVEQIGALMDGSSSLILTTFVGLDSIRMNAFRGAVKERGGLYFVVKNTVLGIAARERGLSKLCGLLGGQVGIVFAEDDLLDLLKIVVAFGKENEELKVLGGVFEGQVWSAPEMLAIAALPPREAVAGQLVSTLASPLFELMHVLTEPLRSLVLFLGSAGKQHDSSLSEQGS